MASKGDAGKTKKYTRKRPLTSGQTPKPKGASKEKKPKLNLDTSPELVYNKWNHLELTESKIESIREYKVTGTVLGEGTFGKVWEVQDSKNNNKFALKLVRKVDLNIKSEIKNLKKIKKLDPSGDKSLFVQLYDDFEFLEHPCLIFNVLGKSVFDFMNDINEGRPYMIEDIKLISLQMIKAVQFHTDLKPENIVFVNREYSQIEYKGEKNFCRMKNRAIQLIDFGGAHTGKGRFKANLHVQTALYRAIQIMLGHSWNAKVDIWSIGCIMYEMLTGKALFYFDDGDDDDKVEKSDYNQLEHLAMMTKILGPIPEEMFNSKKNKNILYQLKNAKFSDPKFKVYYEKDCKPLDEHIDPEDRLNEDVDQLLNLIHQCLIYDDNKRITAAKAIKHQFLSDMPRMVDEVKEVEDDNDDAKTEIDFSIDYQLMGSDETGKDEKEEELDDHSMEINFPVQDEDNLRNSSPDSGYQFHSDLESDDSNGPAGQSKPDIDEIDKNHMDIDEHEDDVAHVESIISNNLASNVSTKSAAPAPISIEIRDSKFNEIVELNENGPEIEPRQDDKPEIESVISGMIDFVSQNDKPVHNEQECDTVYVEQVKKNGEMNESMEIDTMDKDNEHPRNSSPDSGYQTQSDLESDDSKGSPGQSESDSDETEELGKNNIDTYELESPEMIEPLDLDDLSARVSSPMSNSPTSNNDEVRDFTGNVDAIGIVPDSEQSQYDQLEIVSLVSDMIESVSPKDTAVTLNEPECATTFDGKEKNAVVKDSMEIENFDKDDDHPRNFSPDSAYLSHSDVESDYAAISPVQIYSNIEESEETCMDIDDSEVKCASDEFLDSDDLSSLLTDAPNNNEAQNSDFTGNVVGNGPEFELNKFEIKTLICEMIETVTQNETATHNEPESDPELKGIEKEIVNIAAMVNTVNEEEEEPTVLSDLELTETHGIQIETVDFDDDDDDTTINSAVGPIVATNASDKMEIEIETVDVDTGEDMDDESTICDDDEISNSFENIDYSFGNQTESAKPHEDDNDDDDDDDDDDTEIDDESYSSDDDDDEVVFAVNTPLTDGQQIREAIAQHPTVSKYFKKIPNPIIEPMNMSLIPRQAKKHGACIVKRNKLIQRAVEILHDPTKNMDSISLKSFEYKVGDLVMVKCDSYPYWPAIVQPYPEGAPKELKYEFTKLDNSERREFYLQYLGPLLYRTWTNQSEIVGNYTGWYDFGTLIGRKMLDTCQKPHYSSRLKQFVSDFKVPPRMQSEIEGLTVRRAWLHSLAEANVACKMTNEERIRLFTHEYVNEYTKRVVKQQNEHNNQLGTRNRNVAKKNANGKK